ncbi:STAS domain-containing protein [Sphingorhabdus sp. M41]|uniref:STAS domain-containing protein n=1 Tax=Sphingorhabdus sp. M41 TaxID=1806885 RepID=UPI00078CA21B|nr:STAS domain-containing protein [Sphingorhabdus sp. M41]AMO72631.1 hypothetical protein AZE99_12920 [Sphingorhabdus sp. M41]
MPDGALYLPVNCTTTTAEDLRAGLVLAFDNPDGLVIDAGDTVVIGQAVLQLLIAAQRDAEREDIKFAIRGLNDQLTAQFAAYGIDKLTGEPSVAGIDADLSDADSQDEGTNK